MIEKIQNIFKVKELRERILFTLGILIVYRIGSHVPTPGIDAALLQQFFTAQAGTLFGMFDMFVGGAFQRATIFSLGIMPYISASIIIQLLTPIFPYFQRLAKEGEEGRRKITQYTRYGTVLIAMLQAFGVAVWLQSLQPEPGVSVVINPGPGFVALCMITFTAGTIFIMWLGERITERGIGNGISLIIFIGIIATFPRAVIDSFTDLQTGTRTIFSELLVVAIIVVVIGAIVLVTRAQRRIPVQHAKRIVGRKVMGGVTTHLPLSVNTAGVIPIIFAQSIMFAPATLLTLFPQSTFIQDFVSLFTPGHVVYSIVYALIIVFFAYFYTAIVVNPIDMADNMKKQGAFIPGIRPGRSTAEYIDKVLTRITLPGAIFFALIAILPYIMINLFDVKYYFGGTGILIVVGVALDTLQQVESHLIMRHYEGFMKHGRIKGRSTL
ncbi:MAG: preprotein translocase subunit SecY [candidate division Zixibacteria bacterium]|nr:preprotein translocase subunit SecY [candidate division Zixibacteria bacterium]